MSDRLAVLPQYLLPKQALTALAGKVAQAQAGGLTTQLIRWFVQRYQVDMHEAANPDIASYPSFNAFFTRPLKAGARPLAQTALVCPVDGAISQCGPIVGEQIFQAKGHHYSATALVGGDAALAAQFQDGAFATLYLSPRDYHRIHMPCAGRLTRMIYVPGALFSVNPTTARGVPGLFARNERVVCETDSRMLSSLLSNSLTSDDLPAPLGATTTNKLPMWALERGLFIQFLLCLGFYLFGLFQILYLLAHLFNDEFEFERCLGLCQAGGF